MKYLPLRELDDVTAALNFETADCHVVGSCDLYITKAAGGDKKLYKDIEHNLEAQYEALLRFSASLSPPEAKHAEGSLNLSRSSPFGPLTQISSRRTFAYLIATLNASHPEYDFSHYLRPSDFRCEKSLKNVMNTLDTTLHNLRPRPTARHGVSHSWTNSESSAVLPAPTDGPQWGPRMWRVIDKEMNLKDCSIYSYSPDDDPYDDEDGVIWSFNYFFFNKVKKRVCYIYLKGLSLMSQNPVPRTPVSTKQEADSDWSVSDDVGARKLARYWLGPRAAEQELKQDADDGDEAEPEMMPGISRTGERYAYLKLSSRTSRRRKRLRGDDSLSPEDVRSRSKSAVRGVSEDIAENMEL